jgi:hypothetical protein
MPAASRMFRSDATILIAFPHNISVTQMLQVRELKGKIALRRASSDASDRAGQTTFNTVSAPAGKRAPPAQMTQIATITTT